MKKRGATGGWVWGGRALFLAMGCVIGIGIQRLFFSAPGAGAVAEEPAGEETIWTCSMHPQVRLPNPGDCPQCGMDLIPLEPGGSGPEVREIVISAYAAKLMELETAPVERRFVEAEVRMVGKVDFDETQVSHISAWVGGRLDRLFVNYTGIPVRQGDPMVEMYSPDLLTAQEELIQANARLQSLGQSESELLRNTANSTVRAAREKLRLMGLSEAQIETIEGQGHAEDRVTIHAPGQGVVIDKKAQEGMYVQTGTRIYTIANLSTVWVQLDAYESDLRWIRYGGQVEFTTESNPGKVFSGMISFIDPVIDPQRRTARVRLRVDNEELLLKPGMFVRATARVTLAEGGRVMSDDLSGKWISPMHPEIVKDAPGQCDVCGMPLVSADSLGYVDEASARAPLVIPATAALKTGKRAVVYVELPDRDQPTYEGREVRLGARLGDYYLVEEGLQEGLRVVRRGAFKLDAEMQIQARPSMMSAAESGAVGVEVPEVPEVLPGPFEVDAGFSADLAELLHAYFAVQESLAADSAEGARTSTERFLEALDGVDMALLDGDAHLVWMEHVGVLRSAAEGLVEAGTEIQRQREAFHALSGQLLKTVRVFPADVSESMYQATCPMAFDNLGASWLQTGTQINNPYFGAAMLRCGSIDAEIGSELEGGADE